LLSNALVYLLFSRSFLATGVHATLLLPPDNSSQTAYRRAAIIAIARALLMTRLLSFRRGSSTPQCPVLQFPQSGIRPHYLFYYSQLFGLPEN
jgi:hypothetical protein